MSVYEKLNGRAEEIALDVEALQKRVARLEDQIELLRGHLCGEYRWLADERWPGKENFG